MPPADGSNYWLYWSDSPEQNNFGVRVDKSGKRVWVMRHGRSLRRTLGDIRFTTLNAAIKKRNELLVEAEKGNVRVVSVQERKEVKKQQRIETDTFGGVLRDYVEKKRKSGGLPLKERTKADYLAMIEAGGVMASGKPKKDGELYPLANKPIASITGDDIRDLFIELQKRGRGKERRAAYAMQVLRAVLNWAGVKVTDNPLGKDVAGRERIVIAGSKQAPNPIPPEYLGKWWSEATKATADGRGKESAEYLRFKLLTGCRGVEIKGDAYENEPMRVRDVDLVGGRIILKDTKNRKNHTLLLSTQALVIAKKQVEGKKANDLLFDLKYPRRILLAINSAAGLPETAHDEHSLRDTFASIADELVSQYTLKKMMNHSSSGDVTGHYVGKGEAQLRAGWQAVADFIEEQAKPFSGQAAVQEVEDDIGTVEDVINLMSVVANQTEDMEAPKAKRPAKKPKVKPVAAPSPVMAQASLF